MFEGLHQTQKQTIFARGKGDGHADGLEHASFPPTSLLFAYKSSGCAR